MTIMFPFRKKNRHLNTRKMTGILNSNQFIHAKSLAKGTFFFLAQLHVLVLVFDVSSTKIDNRLQRATTLYKLLGKA